MFTLQCNIEAALLEMIILTRANSSICHLNGALVSHKTLKNRTSSQKCKNSIRSGARIKMTCAIENISTGLTDIESL